MEFESIYTQCKNIITNETKSKMMGWIYRCLLQKSIDDGLFFTEVDDGGKIIGFTYAKKLIRTNLIRLEKIGISPLNRRHGLGTKLINKVKQIGLPIKLDVVAKNINAVNFYLKNGFKITGNKVLGKDIDVLVLEFIPEPTH